MSKETYPATALSSHDMRILLIRQADGEKVKVGQQGEVAKCRCIPPTKPVTAME